MSLQHAPYSFRFLKICIFFLLFCLSSHIYAQSLSDLFYLLNNSSNDKQKANYFTKIGNRYSENKSYLKAIEYYEKAIEIDPNNYQLYSDISFAYYKVNDIDKSLYYQKTLVDSLKKNNIPYVKGLKILAELYEIKKDYKQSLITEKELLDLYISKNDFLSVIVTYNNISYIYRQLDQITESESALNKSKEYAAKITPSIKKNTNIDLETEYEVELLINQATNEMKKREFENARNLYIQAINKSTNLEDKTTLGRLYNFISINLYLSDNNASAIEYAEKAITIGEILKNYHIISAACELIAKINADEGNFQTSQEYTNRKNDADNKIISKEQEEKQAIINKQLETDKEEKIARDEVIEKERAQASLRELQLQKEKDAQELKIKNSQIELLRKNQELQNASYKNAELERQKALSDLDVLKHQQELEASKAETERQELLAEKRKNEITQQQELLKKSKENELLNSEKLKAQESITMAIVGIVVLVLIILVYVTVTLNQRTKTNKLLSEQKNEIENKNDKLIESELILKNNYQTLQEKNNILEEQKKEIQKLNENVLSSITYAKRIQTAIFNELNLFESFCKEYFIFLNPKDIVSGDFYWTGRKNDTFIVICADCTGHGVPGAIMSMIGINILNRIVYSEGITSPDLILNELRKELMDKLNIGESDVQDGMDISVLGITQSIAKDEKVIEFAGAINSMVYVEDGEFYEINGDKMPIVGVGESFKTHYYKKHIQNVIGDVVIYMYTDGYKDQFGGPNLKKYNTKRLKDFLNTIKNEPFNQQIEEVRKDFNDWKNNNEQTDDVLLVGFKI
ncbi:MAG: SpoIIE family protein phosphatase [Chitinophagaceae bacterium]|nr:SpoIIE family protein phosphatase [Chitinophagaceae bacterium]